MASCKVGNSADSPGKLEDATVYCKLFADMVTEHLCVLRRRELDHKGDFSCEGCITEKLVNRQM